MDDYPVQDENRLPPAKRRAMSVGAGGAINLGRISFNSAQNYVINFISYSVSIAQNNWNNKLLERDKWLLNMTGWCLKINT